MSLDTYLYSAITDTGDIVNAAFLITYNNLVQASGLVLTLSNSVPRMHTLGACL
jgi:hypothetical protein